jgi:thiosulfate dehydrogenase [quinone] large subunit
MNIQIPEPPVSKFLFSDTRMAWLWLVVRLYAGWQWIHAGWEKLHSAAWVGAQSGTALNGFVNGALAKTLGDHPDVQGWYARFLEHFVLVHPVAWAHLISWGEFLIGCALILGILTGIAACFGLFMNLNFMLAGAVSINPILFVCSLGLVLAWRIAGYIGIDRFLLPYLGTPWQPGKAFKEKPKT